MRTKELDDDYDEPQSSGEKREGAIYEEINGGVFLGA